MCDVKSFISSKENLSSGKKLIRFGSLLPQETGRYSVVKEMALLCERLGFDSIWLYDHLYPFWKDLGDPILECWTTLSALASETKHLRLGTIVLCNLFRYPSVVAKMAATLDVISDGRLEFGIGAGADVNKPECAAFGIPFPRASVRIEQLREAVYVIKKMWIEDDANYKGKYYFIREVSNRPKPIQKPHPPIWIGGIGKKLLRIVAELADGCNFWGLAPEKYRQALDILKQHCLSIRRDWKEIQRSWGGEILLAESKQELKRKIWRFKPKGISVEQYIEGHIVGTPEQCIEKINEYVNTGVTYFMLYFPDMTEMNSLQLFAEHIIPVLRGK